MAISYGTTGPAVSALQNQLNAIGAGQVVSSSGLKVDGIYGDDTQKALDSAYLVLGIDGYSGVASDELLGALAARVGTGNSVLNAVPPGGAPSTGVMATVSSMSTPVKLGLGVAGLAILAGFLGKKKR